MHHDIIVCYGISQAVKHKIRNKIIREPLAKVQRLVVLCQLNKLNPKIRVKRPNQSVKQALPNILLQPLVLVSNL